MRLILVILPLLFASPASAQMLLTIPFGSASDPCAPTTIWNPSDNSNLTLTNTDCQGPLAAGLTTFSAWRSVRATSPQSTGKYYFTAKCQKVSSAGGWIIGVENGSASLTAQPGSDTNGIAFQSANNASQGVVYYNGTYATGYPYCATVGSSGDIIQTAVDLTARPIKYWTRKTGVSAWNNSGGSADPATGTGGISGPSTAGDFYIVFSAYSVNGSDFSSGNLHTSTNTDGSSPPSGYSWWP